MSDVTEVQESVNVPAASKALSDGIKDLIVSAVAAHKAGGGAGLEAMADVMAAVKDLGPSLGQLGVIGTEVKSDPFGVSEALVIGALEAAKVLAGSPGAQ